MITLLVFQGTPVKPENWRELVKAQLEGKALPAPKYPGQQNWKYTISEHGFTDGGNRLPAPTFTSSRNPTCRNCGLRQRTWKGGPPACSCGQDWKYSFAEGGWGGKNYPETPNFESTRNPVCQKCHRMKRGSVRHDQCECPDPAFDDVGLRIQDRQKFQAWCVTWLRECFRVLRPGGTAKIFGATRMMHRMAAAMEEVGFILEPEHSLEGWGYGCLTEDTEVLTHQYGWVSYTRVTVGTVILGFDLQTGDLAWQPVEETFEYPYDREAFRLAGPDTDHVVSVGHRCVVQREGKWAFVLSDDLEGEEVVPIMQRVPGTDPSERGDELACFATTAQVKRVHYTGIVWCVKVPTGAFVARRNGMAFVTGNSGFPKSLNVEKSLDAYIKAQREQEVLAALQAKGFDQVTWSTDHE